MQTLDHGIKRPQNGDSGGAFFPALETNAQRQSDMLSVTQAVAHGSWGADLGGGLYKQTITIPSTLTQYTLTFDQMTLKVKDAAEDWCFPRITRLTDSTFDIYCNDPSVDYTITYTV